MTTHVLVNLPVELLPRSVAFFTVMGFTFNPAYTDANATCLILGEHIFAMVPVKPFFRGFSHQGICDMANAAETITASAVGAPRWMRR
ncbi:MULTISPECIES: VOC family protein [Xanthomonas]|uniref:Glyoxalase n=2 Tax=Xanthomonas TaxID=338 RepID=A0A7Z7IXK5_XANCH|nr:MULTISPECIES: hypothetical protein [Xanthomonas]UZA99253.1 hypothetical protein OM946_19390 [Xanthomonas citri pv. fuscans]UZB04282.1 hypothetical protein OM948_01700 [Xanthomonas citri pv. fuscans]UZB07703.1 hypothetical protein OM953_19420 [Xanthomonas citri pv. fuscans]SON94709.1 hypothetical protein XFF6990_140649 [Xanthomonas citri pv. fuscans]SOO17086.1 hypothetical protein XFF6992_140044 [Xanthomonas citri pv. fuscans]